MPKSLSPRAETSTRLSKPGRKREPEKPYSKYRDRSICPMGHELSDDNTRVDSRGHRTCLACFTENRPTHCPQGHEYNEENTYTDSNDYRHCRIVARAQMLNAVQHSSGRAARMLLRLTAQGAMSTLQKILYWSTKGSRQCRICGRINGAIQNLKRYGITPEQLDRMLESQGYACAICKRDFTEELPKHIDHNHACCPGPYSCGKCVRGLLCQSCNQGIERFKEDPNLIRKAIDYVRTYNPNATEI